MTAYVSIFLESAEMFFFLGSILMYWNENCRIIFLGTEAPVSVTFLVIYWAFGFCKAAKNSSDHLWLNLTRVVPLRSWLKDGRDVRDARVTPSHFSISAVFISSWRPPGQKRVFKQQICTDEDSFSCSI